MKRIALHNKYSQYLSICRNISDVEVVENGDVKFKLKLENGTYSIHLANLADNKMPTVFLYNLKESNKIKPHQLHFKKAELIWLCLSVREDISVKNKNYKEIIDYTLKRLTRLLTLSEAEERREIRKEFLYFWNKVATNERNVNLYIDTSGKAKKLCVYKKNKLLIIYDENIQINNTFKEKLEPELIDAIYIPLINSNRVMPPFEDKKWDIEYLKEICNYCIAEENVQSLESIKISSKKVFLTFEMDIPEVLPATVLLEISFSNNKAANLFERLEYIKEIEHISSQRCDSDYLFSRIGMENICKNKKVLMIGAGSLGSYIINELPKIGINEITIYDHDKFSVENTKRHYLGPLYHGFNKAEAMKFHLELDNPEILIEKKSEMFIENKFEDYSLDKYDLIVVTTGGTDFMLRLNKKFKEIEIGATVIYSWIEANGIGVHALPINYAQKGCFQCLYTGGEVNKAHYGNQKSDARVVGTGCGGVFNSYGNLTLLKGSTMILELIQLHLGRQLYNKNNFLYSIKTVNADEASKYLLSRRGFETTKDFYIDEGCEVCGTYLPKE